MLRIKSSTATLVRNPKALRSSMVINWVPVQAPQPPFGKSRLQEEVQLLSRTGLLEVLLQSFGCVSLLTDQNFLWNARFGLYSTLADSSS